MLLNSIYNFGKISFYFGVVFGISGLVYGIIYGLIEATNKIKSYHPSIIQYNSFYINYYNYLIEYVNSIIYSIGFFGIISFIVGLVLPSIVSFLTILYFINKYNQYFK